MFELAEGYAREGMPAYVRMQEHEFELEEKGYTATRHQREVGAGYFDLVAQAISGGESSTLALVGLYGRSAVRGEAVARRRSRRRIRTRGRSPHAVCVGARAVADSSRTDIRQQTRDYRAG